MPERAGFLQAISRRLRAQQRTFAETITREMGKPITQSLAEIEKCAWLIDHFAENSAKLLQEEMVETEALKSYITFEPLGVILGIMPWNFPFWQVFRFAVPALMAGNVCLLKHASNVPATALAIERLFRDSGVPDHVFKTLLVELRGGHAAHRARTGGRGFSHGERRGGIPNRVSCRAAYQKICAGTGGKRSLYRSGGCGHPQDGAHGPAGENDQLRPELHRRQAVHRHGRQSRGLSWRPSKPRVKAVKIGDPMEPATTIGPLAKQEFVEVLSGQLEDAKRKGARVVDGPPPPSGKGFFFRPAIVSEVTQDMRVVTEEVFGPILPVLIAESEEDLIEMANASLYGLGASIWTRDLARAERLAGKLEVGFVAINDIVKSDPRLPFGGIKKSGIGRELSHYGLKEFMNIKSVVIKGA